MAGPSVKASRGRVARTSGPRVSGVTANPGADVAAALMALGLFLVPLVVDPAAEAAFDAPKRLVAMLVIGTAAAALLWRPAFRSPRTWTSTLPGRVALLGACVVVIAVIAAALSPRRAAAFDALRALLVYSCLPLIGASLAAVHGRGRLLVAAFLGSSALNAIASFLQVRGLATLYVVEIRSGRQDTGAFLGNEGQLAITLALACVAALGLLLQAQRPALRGLVGGVVGICGSVLVLNSSLTALTALAAGVVTLAVLTYRRRAFLPLILIAASFLATVAFVTPIQQRARAVWSDARSGQWDRLLTYRLGPWAAALEMIRERPLFGFGPGTFGAEFVPHRLSAEIRHRTRYLNPTTTASSYGQAHSDYLQLGAEVGIPALLAALAAIGALVFRTCRLGLGDSPGSGEARLLASLLVTGIVTALTWFPFQQAASLLPLGLAAGRAWGLIVEEERS